MIVRSAITFTPPPVPDTPVVVPATSLRFLFTGTDGSTWDLSSKQNPVYLRRGVQGLIPSNVERRYNESPILAGGTPRGYREPLQSVTLPVWVQGAPGIGFRDIDRMFWQALAPDGECVLTVVAPDAETRTQVLVFDGPGDMELDGDPLPWGRIEYPLMFTAPDPFWRGAAVSRTFQPDAGMLTLYDPAGNAVENLYPSNTTGTATIRNDGDVASWPVYAVTGPVNGFSVGVGDSTIDFGPVAAGQTVWIDTHPTRQTVGFERGGNDEAAWLGLTARKFTPIPPGAEVSIVTTLDTPGEAASLLVELTPRYRRPW